MSLSFADLSRPALARILESDARAQAALRAVYGRPFGPLPEAVPGVARARWTALRARHPMPEARVVACRRASDGTKKLLVDLGDVQVETVVIPGPNRSTVCVSSQAGCTRSCRFCATARLPFARNLSAGEIVAQYLLARERAPADRPPRNVVFMGMGEPLDNLEQVLGAVEVLCTDPGPALAPRHVTVSTSGVLPHLETFLRRSRANLALSVNATTPEQRRALMPHDRSWPLEALLAVCRAHLGSRLLFVEYVLLRGVNDSAADARRLANALEGLRCRVNLIPYNPASAAPYERPTAAEVRAFKEVLVAAG
ncbi:MAG: 23S rRNA (adenine(2503)-C(2))-methyltransferase RlmN, partial [Deltaproteobacteria bacterium]